MGNEDLKTQIAWIMNNVSIIDYVEHRGYTVDKKRHCAAYAAYSLNGVDRIVIPRDKMHPLPTRFFSQYEGKLKSIIDFVMERESMKIQQAVEHLLSYANNPRFVSLELQQKDEQKQEKKIQAMRRRHRRYIKLFMKGQPDLTDPSYLLEKRKISVETLQHRAFRDRVYNATYDKADRIAYPLYGTENQVVALAFKSEEYGKIIGAKSNGIWVSKHTISSRLPCDHLFIMEHPINAKSHFELQHFCPGHSLYKPGENNVYVCAMGSPAWSQIDLIQVVIDAKKPKQVVLSHDRDQPKVIPATRPGEEDKILSPAGEVYDQKMIDHLTGPTPFLILKPAQGSDFNDELRVYKDRLAHLSEEHVPSCLTTSPLPPYPTVKQPVPNVQALQDEAPTQETPPQEPLFYRLAKLTTEYYQGHQYHPSRQDEQAWQEEVGSTATQVACLKQHSLKGYGILKYHRLDFNAYMKEKLDEEEFQVLQLLIDAQTP